jgi:hypothetical protein
MMSWVKAAPHLASSSYHQACGLDAANQFVGCSVAERGSHHQLSPTVGPLQGRAVGCVFWSVFESKCGLSLSGRSRCPLIVTTTPLCAVVWNPPRLVTHWRTLVVGGRGFISTTPLPTFGKRRGHVLDSMLGQCANARNAGVVRFAFPMQ